jgi:hypothetical protein
MTARFEKDGENTFDGFDAKTKYQMVPVNDVREMTVVTENSQVTLSTDDPSIVQLADLDPSTSQWTVYNRLFLSPHTRRKFWIQANAPGPTTLNLTDAKTGLGLDVLLVSAKETLSKKYALLFLVDSAVPKPHKTTK